MKEEYIVFSDDDWKELIRLYLDGVPLKGIAAHFGLTVNNVSARLHRLRKAGVNLPYRPRGLKPAGYEELKDFAQEILDSRNKS